MCIQVVERYAVCGCLYYRHQVDHCSSGRKGEHDVQSREVLVGYTCPEHSSSTLPRQPRARARRQGRQESQRDTASSVDKSEFLVHARKESQSDTASRVNRFESLVHARRYARRYRDDNQLRGNRSEFLSHAQKEYFAEFLVELRRYRDDNQLRRNRSEFLLHAQKKSQSDTASRVNRSESLYMREPKARLSVGQTGQMMDK